MEDKKINWKQIIVTAFLTGVVTIIAGMILFNLQAKKPKLTFYAPNASPFQGTDRNFAIYNLTITNTGGTNISNVIGVIQVPDSSIDDIKVATAPSLIYETRIDNDTLNVEIPDLNPSESIAISILATSQSEMNKSPSVSIRGTGIIGEESTSTTNNLKADKIDLLVIVSLVSVISAFSSFLFRRFSSITIAGINIPLPFGGEDVVNGKHSQDQNKVLAYLCGLHGLVEDVDKYLIIQAGTAYWSEADRFSAISILNPGSDETEKRKKILIDLLKYASIAKLSQALIHYNIARIAYAQNSIEEAKEHLGIAKKDGGKLIETRLDLDPNMRTIIEQKSN